MKETVEFRSVELRAGADAGTVEGVLIAYGIMAELGRFKETFTAGCFGALGEIRANVQHVRSRLLAVNKPGGGLTLTDGPDALRARIELPDTAEGRDAAVLIGRGVLTGLSAEFSAKRERWSGRNRTILSAELRGLGIVDLPAHPQSTLEALEARWSESRGRNLAEALENAVSARTEREMVLSVSQQTGLSTESVRQMFRGEGFQPTRSQLEATARVLGVDPVVLINAAALDFDGGAENRRGSGQGAIRARKVWL